MFSILNFTGIFTDSLMIDRLKKKWAARCLFLLIIAISVCSNLWPLGDPDFSQVTKWIENYYSNPAAYITADTIVLPVITQANVIYVLFSIAVSVVFVFLAVLYAGIFVGDKNGQGMGSSILLYIKRLPVLVAFFLLFSVPAIIIAGISPVLLIILIPGLFLAPILIIFEKMNPIHAVTASFAYVKGAKFSIFWDLLTLFFLYQTAEFLFLSFLSADTNAGILLDSFFTAYFVLAIGRLSGIFYDRLRLHPLPPVASPLD